MKVGTLGMIDSVSIFKEYVREGITIKPSVEVTYSGGDGFYLVFETNSAALVQFDELTRIKDQQWGI